MGLCVACISARTRVPAAGLSGAADEEEEEDRKCLQLHFRRKGGPANLDHANRINYPGGVIPGHRSCICSFPGKYKAGWEAVTTNDHSVACVFLSQGHGEGEHVLLQGRGDSAECFCHYIYGIEPEKPDGLRGYRSFGYRSETEWRERGYVPAWGCRWFKAWLENVLEAAAAGQELEVYFFDGLEGQGKLEFGDLRKVEVDLWAGDGLGGSQKCEVAVLDALVRGDKDVIDLLGLSEKFSEDGKNFKGNEFRYRECSVSNFQAYEYPPGLVVEALDKDTWREAQVTTAFNHVTKLFEVDFGNSARAYVESVRPIGEDLMSAVGSEKLSKAFEAALPKAVALESLETVRMQGPKFLQVSVKIATVAALKQMCSMGLSHEISRRVSAELAAQGCDVELRADVSQLVEAYEDGLPRIHTLTSHQKQKLKEIGEARHVHLRAAAGTGKTFVGLQRAATILTDDAASRVLFIALNFPLAATFTRNLAIRLGEHPPWLAPLERFFVMHQPFEHGMCSVRVESGRLVYHPADGTDLMFDLIIVDEAQELFCNEELAKTVLGLLKASCSGADCRLLLLSDMSQAPHAASFIDCKEVFLTEVVRSTQRIVNAAVAFQLRNGSGGPEVTCPDAVPGPMLRSFLFDMEGPQHEAYALQTKVALHGLFIEYPGLSFDHRLAILVPDEKFRDTFKPLLEAVLTQSYPWRQMKLLSSTESVASLPLAARTSGDSESLVLDAIQNFNGLESLFVVCVALDSPLEEADSTANVTRSRLYRGLTRAQLQVLVVNEFLEDGWLAFLSRVSVDENRRASLSRMNAHAASEALAAIENSPGEQQVPEQKDRNLLPDTGEINQPVLPREELSGDTSPKEVQELETSLIPQSIWDPSGHTSPRRVGKLRMNPFGNLELEGVVWSQLEEVTSFPVAIGTLADLGLVGSSWTLMASVWRDSASEGADQAIFGMDEYSDNFNQTCLHMLARGGGLQLHFYRHDYPQFWGGPSISKEQWHHVAAVYDISLQRLTLYLNGKAVRSETCKPLDENRGNRNRLWLGKYARGRHWRGKIREAKVLTSAWQP